MADERWEFIDGYNRAYRISAHRRVEKRVRTGVIRTDRGVHYEPVEEKDGMVMLEGRPKLVDQLMLDAWGAVNPRSSESTDEAD